MTHEDFLHGIIGALKIYVNALPLDEQISFFTVLSAKAELTAINLIQTKLEG
jgi:hypothetical protein